MAGYSNADWIDQAKELPIRFAQVREDPALDMQVVKKAGTNVRVLMVASGGCTACALAAMPAISELTVVDPNQAQIALTKIKLRLLRDCSKVERMQLLGHARMDFGDRKEIFAQLLDSLKLDLIGPTKIVAQMGLDFAGRYEAVFREIASGMKSVEGELTSLLSRSSIERQRDFLEETPKFRETLFETVHEVMNLKNLVALFGEQATRNRAKSFALHFCERTIWAIEHLPARSNPYLWQFLMSRYPPSRATPWVSRNPPGRWPKVHEHVCSIEDYLRNCDEEFDYIHLSNVLDWLSDADASRLLQLTWDRLSPRGYTLIRQLNSNLDIPSLASHFTWLPNQAKALHQSDRSFFYRKMHLARK